MIHNWLDNLTFSIQAGAVMAPVLALLAGLATSITPCSLSNIPLVVGYVGGEGGGRTRRSFQMSLVFVFGTVLSLMILGLAATGLGQLITGYSNLRSVVLGGLMFVVALQLLGIWNLVPTLSHKHPEQNGYKGALLTGMLGGLFASPCSIPILLVLLGVAASSGNFMWGIILMAMYAVGHSILILVAGTSSGFLEKLNGSGRYKTISRISNIIMGLLLLILALNLLFLRI